jgi:nucleoside-diphosphate-sugar epimerase
MAEPPERMEKPFFEVFEPLPGQGPGSRSSAKRALDQCARLRASPANGKAKRLLGWSPRYPSFKEGLAATVPAIERGEVMA